MMSSMKDELIKIKEDREHEPTIGIGLMTKQKFNSMFSHMRSARVLDEKRAGLHASAVIASDSEFCYREQVLSLIYEQAQGKDLPVTSLRIFAAGNSIHEKWQSMFKNCSGYVKNFKLIRNEARSFSEKWKLYFTPDAIVEINGIRYIIEIKSMNTFSYKHVANSTNPHPSARKQLMLYMHLTGIHRGLILLEDKNSQDFEIFEVRYDYKEVVKYLDRLQEIKAQYKELKKNNIQPDRICKNNKVKRAINCNMCEACFGKGVEVK